MEELTKSSSVDQLDILSMDCSWYVRQNPEELDMLSFLIKIQNLLPLSLIRFSS